MSFAKDRKAKFQSSGMLIILSLTKKDTKPRNLEDQVSLGLRNPWNTLTYFWEKMGCSRLFEINYPYLLSAYRISFYKCLLEVLCVPLTEFVYTCTKEHRHGSPLPWPRQDSHALSWLHSSMDQQLHHPNPEPWHPPPQSMCLSILKFHIKTRLANDLWSNLTCWGETAHDWVSSTRCLVIWHHRYLPKLISPFNQFFPLRHAETKYTISIITMFNNLELNVLAQLDSTMRTKLTLLFF